MMFYQATYRRLLPLFFFSALFYMGSGTAGEIEAGDNLPMPEIRWQDGEGKTHQLGDTAGRPRLLHFWAAWCIPCREELPELLQWRDRHPEIDVITLSLDRRIAQTKYFIAKHQLSTPALLLNQDDSDELGIPVLPYTLLVSSAGNLTGYIAGMADWLDANFSQAIQRHFAPSQTQEASH